MVKFYSQDLQEGMMRVGRALQSRREAARRLEVSASDVNLLMQRRNVVASVGRASSAAIRVLYEP